MVLVGKDKVFPMGRGDVERETKREKIDFWLRGSVRRDTTRFGFWLRGWDSQGELRAKERRATYRERQPREGTVHEEENRNERTKCCRL